METAECTCNRDNGYPCDVHGWSTPKRINEIDRMLFRAGIAVLDATTKQARKEADRQITDARVKLAQLQGHLASTTR